MSHPPRTLSGTRLPRKGPTMDHNLLVLSGRLAAPPELRAVAGGRRLARYLVTVRSGPPAQRVDVLPVTLWDPPSTVLEPEPPPGNPIWIAGSLQRRFDEDAGGRRSSIEVVAGVLSLKEVPDVEPFVVAPGMG